MNDPTSIRAVIQEADDAGMVLELTLTDGSELFGYWIEDVKDDDFTIDCGDGLNPNPITIRYDEVAEVETI